MQLFTILAILSATFGTTLAADVCRPTTSDCNNGPAVCCFGIQEGNCCDFGGVRTNVVKMKVPANSRSRSFEGKGCTGNLQTDLNRVARTVCFNYPTPRLSARWEVGLSASRIKRDVGIEACAAPNGVLRVRDGLMTKVELRDGLTVEEALESGEGEVVEPDHDVEYVDSE